MRTKSIFTPLFLFLLFFDVNISLFAQKTDLNYSEDDSKTKENTKISGWIDAQYRFEENEGKQNSIIQIRRARFDYKGNYSGFLDFRLQVDFASSPRLIDAYTKIKFNEHIQLQVGQFKIPFSLENKLSPLELELTDNANIISALSGYKDITGISSYANGREIGAMLTGRLAFVTLQDKRTPLITYGVGLFGGNGINVKSDNLAKDISARIEVCPFVRNLTLSASAYWGKYEMLYNNTPTTMNGARDRYACGAQYADDHWVIRGEYLKGKTDFVDYDEIADSYTPYIIETQGCYLTARYWFFYDRKAGLTFQKKISPLIRYEYYEKDLSGNNTSVYYSTGMDWWPEEHLRLQLAYTMQQKQQSKQLCHMLTGMITVKF